MDKTSHTFKAFANSAYNLVSYVWPTILALFITPIIVFRLGIKEYGIYIFVNTILSFVSIIDLGLGQAVTKHTAFYHGQKNEAGLTSLLRTSNSLFLFVATAGLAIFALIAFAGEKLLPGTFAAYSHYAMLFIIVGLTFFVETTTRTYAAVLNGFQRYDILAKIGMTVFTASSLGTLAIVSSGGGLYPVFIFQLFITSASALFIFRSARKLSPSTAFAFAWDKGEIKKSYAFAFASTVNNIAGLALLYFDKLVIPFYVGPSNLTYYNMPGSIATKIPGVSGSVATAIFPMASHFSADTDKSRLTSLYIRSLRLVTIASAAITISCIAFAHSLLLYWLDADFAAKATGVLVILALTNFVLSLSGLMSNFLLGIGRLRLLTTMSFTTAALNIVLLFILLPRYGIEGAAWAYLLSLAPLVYLFYRVEKTYLDLTARKAYYAKHLFGTLLVSAIVWTFDTYALAPFVNSLISVLVAAATSGVIYVLLYKLLGFFDPTDWHDLERFSKEVLKRGKRPYVRLRLILSNMRLLWRIKSFAVKSRLKRIFRSTKPDLSKPTYSFAIVAIKNKKYVDLAIYAINSLHYLNPNHTITLYCDDICLAYAQKRKSKLDYPSKTSFYKIIDRVDKAWQYYKIEAVIEASKRGEIFIDADSFWHEDPVVNLDKITILVDEGAFSSRANEKAVIERVLGRPDWVSLHHYVVGFVSIPKKFMTPELEADMRMINDKIQSSDMSFLTTEKEKADTRRLSDEFTINLATQSRYPGLVTAFKDVDGPKNTKKMESLYYGCFNQINE